MFTNILGLFYFREQIEGKIVYSPLGSELSQLDNKPRRKTRHEQGIIFRSILNICRHIAGGLYSDVYRMGNVEFF